MWVSMVPAEARGPRSPWNIHLYHSVYDTPLLSWLLLLESPYHNASLFQVIFKVSTQSDGFRCGMCTHACSHTLFLRLSRAFSWSSRSSKDFLSAFMSRGFFLPSFLPCSSHCPTKLSCSYKCFSSLFFFIAIVACGILRNIYESICWVTYNVVDFLMAFSYMCVCELKFPGKKLALALNPLQGWLIRTSLAVEESEILQIWILIILGFFSLLIALIPLHCTWPSSVVTLRKSFGIYLVQVANQPQR